MPNAEQVTGDPEGTFHLIVCDWHSYEHAHTLLQLYGKHVEAFNFAPDYMSLFLRASDEMDTKAYKFLNKLPADMRRYHKRKGSK